MNKLGRIIMLMIVLAVFALSMSVPFEAHSAIVIDHTCTDISQVPEYWINQGKDLFKISYGHTSHGSQIVTGMNVLKNLYGALYDFNYSGSGGALSFHDYEPSGDLGNPDRTTWAQRTRDLLDTPGNDRNFIMWSWCGQADTTPGNMQIYLDLMGGLEADYPDVTFIYMTGHLNGTGETGNLHQRNNQIRSHVMSNNGVLFDFADIESYDPDGNYFLDLGADDGCNYSGGNWADQWCTAHPGDDLCTTCSCAHSKPLNCNLKGRAFWWMMAQLAGWNPGSTTSITTTVDPNDTDSDGVPDDEDNCPLIPNGPELGVCYATSYSSDIGMTCVSNDACDGECVMNQEEYVCDCKSSFDCDLNVDAYDVSTFINNFGRNSYFQPCTNDQPCIADYECDSDVDADDVNEFLLDFSGRFLCGPSFCLFPCISCIEGDYVYSCTYE